MSDLLIDSENQPASQPDKPSRLKVIGLALIGLGLLVQVTSFQFLSALDSCEPSAQSRNISLALLVIGMGVAAGGLSSYARAKGRHMAIGSLALLPILGPILAVVAITLSEWALPWIVRRLIVGCLLIGVLGAVMIPNFLRYGMTSRQAEARTNLGGIYAAEMSFYDEHKRFGNFEEIGFTLAGTSNRYSYRIDGSGTRGTEIPNGMGQPTGDNTVVPAGISPDGQGFTATATGNLDNDPTIDMWHVNDRKECLTSADTDDTRN